MRGEEAPTITMPRRQRPSAVGSALLVMSSNRAVRLPQRSKFRTSEWQIGRVGCGGGDGGRTDLLLASATVS